MNENHFAVRIKQTHFVSLALMRRTLVPGTLLAICYLPTIQRLFQEWTTNDDMSHGLFVPFFAGWILWNSRTRLATIEQRPAKFGFVLLVLGAVFACTGPPDMQTFAFLTRLSLLLSICGLVLAVYGWQMIRAMAYPIILLLLMIPLPGFIYSRITLPLQLIASQFAEHGLEILGYSVLREGNIIHMPRQTLEVVEACSGLRSLMSLVFLSQVYIYLFDNRPWMRWATLAAIVPIAILANGGRIIFTAIMSQIDRAWGEGILHASTAWGVFVIAFAILLATHWVWKSVEGVLAKSTAQPGA